MQNIKGKTMAILIAAILTISIGATMTMLQPASAHTPPYNIKLFAFMNVGPDTCGLGQSVNLGFWLSTPPPTANGAYGDRYGPFSLHILQPDGTVQVIGGFISDDTGGTHYQYTPPELGSYIIWMTFPGMTLTGGTNNVNNTASTTNPYVGDYILPEQTANATLTVVQQPSLLLPNPPLPTSYWQTPVSSQNVVNWNQLTGPFLDIGRSFGTMYNQSANYNPYTAAPLAPHIMWTLPEAFGGVLGGPYPATTSAGTYYSVAQYEPKYEPVIINGYEVFTWIEGSTSYESQVICIDLYTGKTIWSDNAQNWDGSSSLYNCLTSTGGITPVAFGQVLDFIAPNQYGGLAYFWTTGTPAWITNEVNTQLTPAGLPVAGGIHISGSTYNMYDFETGKYILSIVNATGLTAGPSGGSQLTVDSTGSLLDYYVNTTVGTEALYQITAQGVTFPVYQNNTTPTLNEWNSTQCIRYATGGGTSFSWSPPFDGIVNFADGIMYSQPVFTTGPNPSNPTAPGNQSLGGQLPTIWAMNSGVIVVYTGVNVPGIALSFTLGTVVWAGYNQTNGQQLWIENDTLVPYTSENLNCQYLAGNGIFITENRETGNFSGYSLVTGAQLWTDDVLPNSDTYDAIGAYQGVIAGGTIYMIGFGGDVWSINMTNGFINWYTNTTKIQGYAGYNTPYNVWPIWEQTGLGVAGGLLLLEEGHEYSPPTFNGAQFLALNDTTGQLVWNIDGFDVNGIPYMAYGQIDVIDAYNNLIEDFGQGPSQTTISAPQVGVTTAAPITITGSVMDVCAGSKQEQVAADFPNGLPAVSDASMGGFMAAVYMSQPMPTNITGVPVSITVTDQNGNSRVIGTTTTNTMGTYGITYTPEIPGNYTVVATFAGSGGYYGSSAETYFYASAPPATPAPTSAPASNLATASDLTYGIAVAVIAIIIAIAIVGLLLLRKKP
jgi:hypothetical protein